MKVAVQILAFVIGAAAFLPWVPSNVWWIRGLEFPRMQLLVLGVTAAVALGIFGFDSGADWLVFAFLGAGVAVQIWRMRPYTRWARRQVPEASGEGRRISFLIANVLMTNRDAKRLLACVRRANPDVLLAVETDAWWVEQLRELADGWPEAVEVPQENTYGMVLRSRLALTEVTVERLIREDVPSIHGTMKLPGEGGQAVRFYAVHPRPPFPDEAKTTRTRDAELLLVGTMVAERGGPAIVAGDLNDVAWSRTTRRFQKVSGLLDPRVGRGRFNTYHAYHWWLRWPLDHVFVSSHFRLRRLELLPPIGSDHFPILVDLTFEEHPDDAETAGDPSALYESESGVLEEVAKGAEELGADSSVDDTMVARERQ